MGRRADRLRTSSTSTEDVVDVRDLVVHHTRERFLELGSTMCRPTDRRLDDG
jgi:hypothetical protein